MCAADLQANSEGPACVVPSLLRFCLVWRREERGEMGREAKEGKAKGRKEAAEVRD